MKENLAFEYKDGTKIEGGCGATFENTFWYFGGKSSGGGNIRQVIFSEFVLKFSFIYSS